MSQRSGHARGRDFRPEFWLLTVIAVILTGWALRAMTVVFVPVILAFFLALMIYPLDRMASDTLPRRLRWLGHALALSVVLMALIVFLGSLWLAAEQVVNRFEDAEVADFVPERLLQSTTNGNAEGSRFGGAFSDATQSLASQAVERISGMAQWVVNTAGSMLAGMILVIFLILMMLIEARRWEEKLSETISRRANLETRDALAVIAARLRRYLLTRIVVGAITAALYALWLWLFGIDLLFVWAILAFLLNFVPTFGSLIAGALAVAYAYLQTDVTQATFVGVGLLVIEQVMGNFVDPRIQGKQVSVSPLVILIVLVLWTWIWGPMGAILGVPVVVALVIFFSHSEMLRPVALFLSNETSQADLDRATEGSGKSS